MIGMLDRQNRTVGAAGALGARIRIAVADDHPIFRDSLCQLLGMEEDFEVVAQAADGYRALDILRQSEPDILLMDLRMPGLHGLATLQRLQGSNSRTRVIVLTASDDMRELGRALRLGTRGIVLKQTAAELLFQSVRKVHAGEIWLDSQATSALIRQFTAGGRTTVPPPPAAPPTREREGYILTQREREIVAFVSRGYKNKELADKMYISEQTVKNHMRNIFDKLGVSDRLELGLFAIQNHLHEMPGLFEMSPGSACRGAGYLDNIWSHDPE